MNLVSILILVIGGGLVGWVASKIMKIKLSTIMSIVLGIVGSYGGNAIASALGLGDFAGQINWQNGLVSVLGSIVPLLIAKFVKK